MQLEDIRKDFGAGEVLRGITLSVPAGEFVTILGPSGCGKTTTLRIIAGLEAPSGGRVLLDGMDVTSLPPEKRDVNTVFQNYALFPHMNVAKNIGYGLRLRGVAKADISRRVEEMLALVQLPGFEKRVPDSLSGGQRQRVAIARALVLSPHVLLLDEPLGALDLQLRRQMQGELKSLQKALGITFIYITHDQEEAMNMSDRIALMQAGQLEQVGTPEEIYERPSTRFAATFLGQTALLSCAALEKGAVLLAGAKIPAEYAHTKYKAGAPLALCLRAERARFDAAAPEGQWSLPATLLDYRFSGGLMRATLALPDGQQLSAYHPDGPALSPGSAVRVWWNVAQATVLS